MQRIGNHFCVIDLQLQNLVELTLWPTQQHPQLFQHRRAASISRSEPSHG
ncbi:hypothetical protein SynBIOSE41_01397 [Synechococcus sp. BIOS-E4-1]|nr:hypothetical protein SynBIOSE41_01397 [Synechococcus sp. BIOS-E4-1]